MVRPWNNLIRDMMESLPLEVLRSVWLWHLGLWFRGDYSGAGLMVRQEELEGIFQHL